MYVVIIESMTLHLEAKEKVLTRFDSKAGSTGIVSERNIHLNIPGLVE